MKKVIMLTCCIVLCFLSCKENNAEQQKEEFTAAEGSKVVKIDVTDFDRYEGKIVKSTTGQWYLIKEACRWRTNSVQATDDYLKKLPAGPDYVDENVPVEVLQQFPETGELLPGVQFKKDERKVAP